MLTTKKVIEDAIKVRQEEWDKLDYKEKQMIKSHSLDPNQHLFILSEMENFESQIAELKQNLQDVFEAHNKRQSLV